MSDDENPIYRDPRATGRNLPGQGELITLYVINEANAKAEGFAWEDVLVATTNEDFAVCRWPVVVKVKQHVTEAELLRNLLYLASVLEQAIQEGCPPQA